MFELHTTDLDITAGALEVTWCLDKDLLNSLKKEANSLVIVSVIPLDKDGDCNKEKEHRYIFPLKQMMGYVSFRSPGKNKIFAYIETGRTNILTKGYRGYETDIVHYDGKYTKIITGWDEQHCEQDRSGQETLWTEHHPEKPHAQALEVEVPAEYFGKEPSKSEKAWVLWLIKDKGVDQCAFRRRRIFAYTVQPFIFILNLFLRFFMASVALLLGLRCFTLKYLLHPLTYELSILFGEFFNGGTIFVRPEPSQWKDKEPRTFIEVVSYLFVRGWSLPFMPPIAFACCELTIHHGWKWVGVGVLFLILISIIIAICASFTDIISWLSTKMEEIGGDNDMDDLICTGDPTMHRPKNRSIKLRYLALKSKVCKPFAG